MNIVKLDYNRGNTVTRANRLFFIFCTLYFLSRLIITMYMSIQINMYGIDVANNQIEDLRYPVILFNELVLVLLPCVIYTIIYRLNIPYGFRFNSLQFKNVLMVLFLCIPLYVFLSSLNSLSFYFLQRIGEIPANDIPVPQNAGEYVFSLFIVAFVPAVCEEYFMRGILLNAYNRRGAFGAIMISGIFFTIFHFDVTNLFAPFFFGIIIGYVVLKTNSIYAGVLAHFLNNAIAQTMQYFLYNPNSSDTIHILLEDLPTILLQCLVSLAIILSLLMAIKAMNPESKLKKPIRNPFLGALDIVTHWPIFLSLSLYGAMIYLKFGV